MSNLADSKSPSVWMPILAVLGGAVGSAAWVSLVGAIVLALRLGKIDVAPGATVALVPSEQEAIIGLGFIALPLLAALLGFVLLLFLRPRDDVAESGNEPGSVPARLTEVLVVLTVLAVVGVSTTGITNPLAQSAALALPVLTAVGVYYAVKKTSGFGEASLVLFVAVALCAGVVAVIDERGRPPSLDLAVVLRKDGSGLGGYYVAQTADAVYLVTPTLVGGRTLPETAQQVPLPSGARPCPPAGVVGRLNGEPPRCYVAGLVSVPTDQVGKVLLGPPAVPVDVAGYNAARQLAGVATARSDEERRATPASHGSSKARAPGE